MPDSSRVASLFAQLCGDDRAAALTSKRELWRTVRQAQGGQVLPKTSPRSLPSCLCGWPKTESPLAARRELLWMLSEIGGDESVDPIAALLADIDLREDARMTLQRIPGDKSLAALEVGLAAAPNDFKINIVQSLAQPVA